MRAWLKSVVGSASTQSKPSTFSGCGVYLTTEVHSARYTTGPFSPSHLIESLSRILGYQSAVIEKHGGHIEQFVGDCIVAYWRPSDPTNLATCARHAAEELIRGKMKVQDLVYSLRIGFAVAELAGAYFGPVSRERFQVIGKARDRANHLPRFLVANDFIVTDAQTWVAMPVATRTGFVAFGPAAYALQLD